MKKVIAVFVLMALVAAAVVFVHPTMVYSSTSYSYRLYFTWQQVELDGISDVSGGYRCYVDEDHYIHLSRAECVTVNEGSPIFVEFQFPWQPPILNRGEG